jgi:ABC-type amino acid transport system permease subunit
MRLRSGKRRRGPHTTQLAAGLVAAVVVVALGLSMWSALEARGISLGFGFLGRAANFDIGDAPIAYTPSDTFARALLVGLVNTARIAAAGWVLSLVFGFCSASRAFLSIHRCAARRAGSWKWCATRRCCCCCSF